MMMASYNRKFELSIGDMELIEVALRKKLAAQQETDESSKNEVSAQVHDLLGRLHSQKTFYRPKDGPYISG